MANVSRSMVKAIAAHPDDPAKRLQTLRLIVATKLDATDSARETSTLARVLLDIEAAMKGVGADAPRGAVDDLLARRVERGAS